MGRKSVWLSVFGSAFSEKEIAAAQRPLQQQWVGMGPAVEALESALSVKVGNAEVVLVNSGSSALQLAIEALNLRPGGLFLLPANSWNSCANAVILNGLVPRFVDCDPRTGNVDPDALRRAINDDVVAIMVIHYAGLPVNMREVLSFGLPVVEDAAHAIDSYYDGQHCGTIGDVGIFSFDAVKNIATPDLGAVVTRDSNIAARIRSTRYSGIAKSGQESSSRGDEWWVPHQVAAMPKFAPNDVAAAIGLAQLDRLGELQSIRRQLWMSYTDRLAGVEGVILPPESEGASEQHSWFTFFIRVPGEVRNQLARHLLDEGIYSTVRYHPLHLLPFYREQEGSSAVSLPGAEQFGREVLNLPLHPRMVERDVDEVCRQVRVFLTEQHASKFR